MGSVVEVHVGSGVHVGAMVGVDTAVRVSGAPVQPTATAHAAANPTPIARAYNRMWRRYGNQDGIPISISHYLASGQ